MQVDGLALMSLGSRSPSLVKVFRNQKSDPHFGFSSSIANTSGGDIVVTVFPTMKFSRPPVSTSIPAPHVSTIVLLATRLKLEPPDNASAALVHDESFSRFSWEKELALEPSISTASTKPMSVPVAPLRLLKRLWLPPLT